MAIRIVGVDLPQNKRGEIALTYIYGIGRSSSAKILELTEESKYPTGRMTRQVRFVRLSPMNIKWKVTCVVKFR